MPRLATIHFRVSPGERVNISNVDETRKCFSRRESIPRDEEGRRRRTDDNSHQRAPHPHTHTRCINEAAGKPLWMSPEIRSEDGWSTRIMFIEIY